MALEIGTIVVLVLLLFVDRTYRGAEPQFWESWDLLRRGATPKLEVIEEHLATGLDLLLETGCAAQSAHVLGDQVQPAQLLGMLLAALDEWLALMSKHLLAALAWWAVQRANVEVRPVPVSRVYLGELRLLIRVEWALFSIVPTALRVGLHARVLDFALRLMPRMFRTLEQPAAPTLPWLRLAAAVEDLDTFGHEALATVRALRLSLVAPDDEAVVRPTRHDEL